MTKIKLQVEPEPNTDMNSEIVLMQTLGGGVESDSSSDESEEAEQEEEEQEDSGDFKRPRIENVSGENEIVENPPGEWNENYPKPKNIDKLYDGFKALPVDERGELTDKPGIRNHGLWSTFQVYKKFPSIAHCNRPGCGMVVNLGKSSSTSKLTAHNNSRHAGLTPKVEKVLDMNGMSPDDQGSLALIGGTRKSTGSSGVGLSPSAGSSSSSAGGVPGFSASSDNGTNVFTAKYPSASSHFRRAIASGVKKPVVVSNFNSKSVIIVGVSNIPGVGYGLAVKFAAQGYAVGLIGRQEDRLDAARAGILLSSPGAQVAIATADSSDKTSIEAAITEIAAANGPADVLLYNAAPRPYPTCNIMDITPERLVGDFTSSVLGALLCSQAVIPHMRAKKSGTIIITGATASLRGSAAYGSFAAAKGGLRQLAQSMARELNPEGIHVAHVVLDGMIDMPVINNLFPDAEENKKMDTNAIADAFWFLHSQPPSCFTFELDIRPHGATW